MNYQEWASGKIDKSFLGCLLDDLPKDLRDEIINWAGGRGIYDLDSDSDMETAKENFISNWNADIEG